jgi:hypothetical protein
MSRVVEDNLQGMIKVINKMVDSKEDKLNVGTEGHSNSNNIPHLRRSGPML